MPIFGMGYFAKRKKILCFRKIIVDFVKLVDYIAPYYLYVVDNIVL